MVNLLRILPKLNLTAKIGNCINRPYSAMSNVPKPIVVEPSETCRASVIFLHGLGDTGHGWSETMSGELAIKGVRYVCPTAPSIPVTINMGMRMPAWYDITSIDERSQEDISGIKSSAAYVHTLIEAEEEKGVLSENIFVGGFSQGGAIALYAGLSYKNKLGGIVAMSCYLPIRDEFPAVVKTNKETPIIQCHGTSDPVVPFRFGHMSSALISGFNPKLEFKSYTGMAHTACPQELGDIKKFLTKNVSD